MSDAGPRLADPAMGLWAFWRAGQRPDIRRFLDCIGPLTPSDLAAVLRVDQRERWENDDHVTAADYLRQFSQLDEDPEAAFEIIYAEYLLREELGQAPSPDSFLAGYPEFADRLRIQIDFHRALGTTTGPGTEVPASGPLGQRSRRNAGTARRRDAGPCRAATRSWASWAAAAWGSSTRRGSVSLEPPGGPEDDPGRRATPAPSELRAVPAARPRRSPGSTTPTSCQIYESASTTACRSSRWSLLDGGSLADRLGRHAAAGRRPRRRWWPTLARAVQHAHRRGDRPPRPQAGQRPARPTTARRKITDFGLAKRLEADDATLTATGADPGHAQLHGPRAGRGPGERRRPGGRRLRPGGDPLRVPDRPAARSRRQRRWRPWSRCRTDEPGRRRGSAAERARATWRRSA